MPCIIGRSGTRRRFCGGSLNIGLCRGCLLRVSVFVMCVFVGIPWTRGDNMAFKVGRMGRTSWSRLQGLPYAANWGKGGGSVGSCRASASVIVVYWSVAVTIVSVCCVYWFGSEQSR